MPTNKKTRYYTGMALVPLFVLTSYSGLELHIAGHSTSHEIWHNWSVFHILSSIVFLLVAVLHIRHHWGWYKRLLKGLKYKSKVTFFLSMVFIIIVLTGFYLLFFAEGANTTIGLFHYKVGLVMIVIGGWHILKRIY